MMNMLDTGRLTEQLQYALDKAKKEEFEQCLELLNSLKVVNLTNYLISKVSTSGKLDKDESLLAEFIIRITQEIYNNSADIVSPISDENYDILYEIYRAESGEDIIGASNGSRNKAIYQHKYPDLRGTLDKVHFITNDEKRVNEKRRSIEDFIKSIEAKLGHPLMGAQKRAVITPKWDGISVVKEVNKVGRVTRALKRGDTTKNEAEEIPNLFQNVTFNTLDKIKGHNAGIKTEVVMSRENFDKLCQTYGDFKSPRSAVSSIVNSKVPSQKYLEFLNIKVLRTQIEGQDTSELCLGDISSYRFINDIKDFADLKRNIDSLVEYVEEFEQIDIDGIVISLLDENIISELGRENNINKHEVAYKLPPKQAKAILKSVDFSVGVLGAVTPMARIEPVKLKGSTIKSISLGSIARFESLQLAAGDEVIIKYDVIPYLEIDDSCQRSGNEPFTPPTHCPYCEKKLIATPELKCDNDDCPSRVIGKIMNYVTKMSIPNISIGIITVFWKRGFLKTIEDLYSLSDYKEDIINMRGFEHKSYSRIIDGINSRQKVFDYEVLGSIGIPSIGRKMFKKVLGLYTIDELIELAQKDAVSKLTAIQGIKEKTASKILSGIMKNLDLIRFLTTKLDVVRDTRKYTIKVAFTKVRDKDFEKYLDAKDVLVKDNYDKSVDILIVPDYQTTSSKVAKAKKDNKEVVSIDDAYRMFEYTSTKGGD